MLADIVIVFALSVAVVFLCGKFKIPAIVGYLITGVIAGPHAANLIKAEHEVEILAEIGVIMILFAIGMEFSIKKLLKIKSIVLVGGFLQFTITAGATAFLTYSLIDGFSSNSAIFAGFLAGLSSTAIVLSILHGKGEIDSPVGKFSLGVLIFQDLAIIPLTLLTPILAGAAGDLKSAAIEMFAKVAAIILIVFVASRWIIPKLMFQIAKTRIRELFILSTMLICLAIVWGASESGLSLALGAFLAGLIISESDYSLEALSNVLPLKDIFSSFFFVSVGMLLNIGFLIENIGVIAILLVSISILKTLAAAIPAIILKYALRRAFIIGFTLFQIGEFSFVLAKSRLGLNLIGEDIYQYFLAISVLTMAMTPFLIQAAPKIAENMFKFKPLRAADRKLNRIENDEQLKEFSDHIIIVGFGVTGRNVAKAADYIKIPYIVVEINPETVKNEKNAGVPIVYGNASQEETLKHAGLDNCRTVALAVPDSELVARIASQIKKINPNAYVIARERFVGNIQKLLDAGVDEAIAEEYETAIEIFARIMNKYLVPEEEIHAEIDAIRSGGYDALRKPIMPSNIAANDDLRRSEHAFKVYNLPPRSAFCDKSLAELQLRNKYGVSVLAIRRAKRFMPNPGGDDVLRGEDSLVVFGSVDSLGAFAKVLKS